MKATWANILAEIGTLRQGDPGCHDTVRQLKAQAVHDHTKRPLIVYASACTTTRSLPGHILQIDYSDLIAFEEVSSRLPQGGLDLLVHSPGGRPEAVDSIVTLLRKKFSHIRCVVPAFAKSAATMLALSADTILMSDSAELGPIDPQMIGPTWIAPADLIKEQFEKAREEILQDSNRLIPWMPILGMMGPALLVECDEAIALTKQLMVQWMSKYMFQDKPNREELANEVADFLSKRENFKSHSKRVGIEELRNLRVACRSLEQEPALKDLMWELYCAVDITLSNTTAAKLIENHLGDRVIRFHSGGEVRMLPQLSMAIPESQP